MNLENVYPLLLKLKPEERMLLVFRFLLLEEETNYLELGRMMKLCFDTDFPQSCLRVRWHRLRKKLRDDPEWRECFER